MPTQRGDAASSRFGRNDTASGVVSGYQQAASHIDAKFISRNIKAYDKWGFPQDLKRLAQMTDTQRENAAANAVIKKFLDARKGSKPPTGGNPPGGGNNPPGNPKPPKPGPVKPTPKPKPKPKPKPPKAPKPKNPTAPPPPNKPKPKPTAPPPPNKPSKPTSPPPPNKPPLGVGTGPIKS